MIDPTIQRVLALFISIGVLLFSIASTNKLYDHADHLAKAGFMHEMFDCMNRRLVCLVLTMALAIWTCTLLVRLGSEP